MQVATFAINYQGHPFMQSVRENKGLFYSLFAIFGILFVTGSEIMPEFNVGFDLVIFPGDVRVKTRYEMDEAFFCVQPVPLNCVYTLVPLQVGRCDGIGLWISLVLRTSVQVAPVQVGKDMFNQKKHIK
jgi:hypothetical protein